MRLPCVELEVSQLYGKLYQGFPQVLRTQREILSYYLLCFFQESFHGRVFHVSIVGGDVFQMGGASFLSGGCPQGASVLVGGGVFEKYREMAGGTPTMGNPACSHYFVQCRFMSLYFLPLWICNFPLSLFNKSPFFVKLITQSY